MMMQELFEQAPGEPVTIDGVLYLPWVELIPNRQADVTVCFNSFKAAPDQGITVGIRAGEVRTGQYPWHQGLAFWASTFPGIAKVSQSSLETPLLVRNCWRYRGGVEKGVGHAAICPERIEDGVRLRCSDGEDALTLGDIVVSITWPGGAYRVKHLD